MVVGGLSVALTLFHLYTGIFGSRPSLIQGAIHLGGASSIIFLLYRPGSGSNGAAARQASPGGTPSWRSWRLPRICTSWSGTRT